LLSGGLRSRDKPKDSDEILVARRETN
jgi:hypothetical protein